MIGNSITRHPPLPSIGWTGDWGMAASSREKDFAHLTGAALGLPVTAINAVQLENDPQAPVPQFPVDAQTVVIVALGDNGLPAKYADLLASVNHGAALLCMSTYWTAQARDAVIKAECEKAGGRFVFVGNIYWGRLDDTSPWPSPVIQAHPYDWSMARIAERMVAALNR